MPGNLMFAVVWAFGVIGASTLMHELGHAWVARAVGWRVIGLQWSLKGISLAADTNGKPEQTWKVAAGGLAVTGALALCFLAGTALPQPVSGLLLFGFAFNAVVLLVNLIPVRSSDGGLMLAAIGTDKQT